MILTIEFRPNTTPSQDRSFSWAASPLPRGTMDPDGSGGGEVSNINFLFQNLTLTQRYRCTIRIVRQMSLPHIEFLWQWDIFFYDDGSTVVSISFFFFLQTMGLPFSGFSILFVSLLLNNSRTWAILIQNSFFLIKCAERIQCFACKRNFSSSSSSFWP